MIIMAIMIIIIRLTTQGGSGHGTPPRDHERPPLTLSLSLFFLRIDFVSIDSTIHDFYNILVNN